MLCVHRKYTSQEITVKSRSGFFIKLKIIFFFSKKKTDRRMLFYMVLMIWLEMTTKERKCRYIKSSFSIKFNLTSSLYHHYVMKIQ